MLNKRIAVGFMSIAGALAIAGGATFAYFTDTVNSATNTFTAGTLNIQVDQTGLVSSPVVSDWAPGESETVRFDIKNTGTLPVNLKANATGNWVEVANPEPESVKVTKVEYYDGSDWITIKSVNAGINGDVYYSPNGNNNNLSSLLSGQTLPIRITVKFDELADERYEGKSFNAVLKVDAKQINAPSF